MHEEASRFVERLGLQIEAEGFPRIAGRMIGYLLLQEEPSSLDELAEKLQVSKASVSTNARALEQRGIVERCSIPGDRRDYYMIVDEPWSRMMDTLRDQFRSRVELFGETRAVLPTEFEAGRRRLDTWKRYFTYLLEQVDWLCTRHGSTEVGIAESGQGVEAGQGVVAYGPGDSEEI